jgi:hypothetical protein
LLSTQDGLAHNLQFLSTHQMEMIISREPRVFMSALVLAFLLAGSQVARADTAETFAGCQNALVMGVCPNGSLAASAVFDLSGTTLTVTLTNTSHDDTTDNTDVLTAVAFDVNPSHTLTPVSASLNGSTTIGSIANVGDGWGYGTGLSAHGQNSAISASGTFNGLGHSNFSAASNSLGGSNYGVLAAGTVASDLNHGTQNQEPFVVDSVQFRLTASSGFTLADLGSSVVFQFGTSTSEPSFDGSCTNCTAVPEASTVDFLAADFGLMGLVGAFFYLRRKRGAAARS